ncbi:MAG: hypothetical protein ACK449_13020 [Planctomycetota bacterium]|jgi:hypothetical protein
MSPSISSRIRIPALRVLVLLVWLLGIPGLRPAFHHHQLTNLSELEQIQMVEHLKFYPHPESQDTEKLHLHWLVLLDGSPIQVLPNSSISSELALLSPSIESETASEFLFPIDDAYGVFFCDSVLDCPRATLPNCAGHLNANEHLLVPIHSRFDAYATALYTSAYL